ncbi:uncharacterized protein CTRU02_209328 [Colletotrichum truncatum]|uniref:Uncharacterized protein n=1 Tax=Colletotrichum truncatum TaxID=5467 RepID=A0ACC3YS85_COLTU|nr:uncharacterized protein CTRU02_08597 [Colletotrichum truncatum]KAF6789898.1 hypothetical protein CTRU02_08597 [Colletotrichum truncatum]
MSVFDGPNCTAVQANAPVPSDAGVAGIGVLLSFIITAGLSLIISSSIIIQEMKGKPSNILRKLLNSYSDQQILQGIGISSVGLARINSMVPYHFFIIWTLSNMSMAVHNATLLALVHDFRRDWVLRWLRQFLMFVNLVFNCVYGVFILQGVSIGMQDSKLPVACVWKVSNEGLRSMTGLSYVGTILVIAGNVLVFSFASWYLHLRTQRFAKIIKLVGTFLMAVSAVGAAVRCIIASDAFGKGPVYDLSDEGEKGWSFGQLLSLLVLLFPLVSMVEIVRGEIKVAPCDLTDGGKSNDTEMDAYRTSYQPNPFFGSQTNLFKR